nr:MAG TPA: hypothetical protein [Caudoviricetes sp.]
MDSKTKNWTFKGSKVQKWISLLKHSNNRQYLLILNKS